MLTARQLDAAQNGLVQGLREVPGLLGVTLLLFLYFMREHRLAAFSVIASGIGTLRTGMFPSFVPLIFTTVPSATG